MWSGVIPALNLGLIWLLGLTLAFMLLNQSRVSHYLARLKRPLLFLILVALIARLASSAAAACRRWIRY